MWFYRGYLKRKWFFKILLVFLISFYFLGSDNDTLAVTSNTDLGGFFVVVVNDFEVFRTGASICDQEIIIRIVLIVAI